MGERPTLVVMVKAPRPGRVKTRLAAQVGPTEALRFTRAATAALLRRLGRDPRWRLVLAVAPDHLAQAGFWPPGIPRLPQGPGDLGARMQRLFDRATGPVVIVGSDIPGIRPGHVARAVRLLGRAEAVLGPAEDGGYWLVGARRRPRVPRPFAGVRWSGPHALADTLNNLSGPAAFADRLEDVDTLEAWRRWRRAGAR
ncbi:TIGR04282 family arsenosugar biosynthesis glycosyltransferase [Methylobacterium oryzisoli]|uniref:TIGR04282 family arsenosugar biosynthesis glycosyltransferase n=1 Tax=Methylobacterium oryzisoli TaxID=3385502 RepID=UPI0038914034